MPLIKSKSDKAFKSNIKAEVKAGKPVKQAVAIAYSTKRAAKKATGGGMTASDAHKYDSDIDYYDSISRRGDEDGEVDNTPNRVVKADQRRLKQYHKAVGDVSKKFTAAKKSGDEAGLKKAQDRWGRVQLSRNLQTRAKTMPGLAQKAREDWSEKIGGGKPAPFKSGGKANKNCW